MNRRTFIGAAAGLSLAHAAPMPMVDTHIHLFDPTRPQGVPWPPKDNTVLYHTALPDRYRKIAVPLGITGAIEVECSPWLEDNQWVLDVIAKDKIMLGMVGDLEPGKPDFRRHLERFHRSPFYLGIRYGNLWGRNLTAEIERPEFMADLKMLADAGLEMDTANPTPELIGTVLRLTDRVPDLRVVIDHLPRMEPPTDAAVRRAYETNLRELGKRPQVYIKVSGVLRRVNGRIPSDLEIYRPTLDQLWQIFGEDRLIYGSDWPNSDQWAPYEEELKIVRAYFTAKGPVAAEKYFWKNSKAAYRWRERK